MITAILYTIFALIATVTNIISQDLVTRFYAGPYPILLSIFLGTLVGLVVKYILDKKYIFKYQVNDATEDSKVFLLYAIMGIVTTVIFWGFEFCFDHIYKTKTMRYWGGIIGLGIGYIIKYQLDKRYVFISNKL